MNKRLKITVQEGETALNPFETQALRRGGNFLCAGHGSCAPAANFIVYKARGRVQTGSQKMKEFSVGGHRVSRPPTLRGERSRPRGGLTLPKSSGSGNEQITSQKAAPAGVENDNIMTNKLIHARSGNISNKKKDVIEGVELKTKLAQTYLSELDNISSEQEALYWARGVPMEIARTLFLLVALKKTKRCVQIV